MFITEVESDKPFTPEEEEVMQHLVDAWNKYIQLPGNTANGKKDFCDGIHNLQRILSMHTMRRLYPDYFIM